MGENTKLAMAGGTVTEITMNYEFNLFGASTVLKGRNYINFPAIEDALVEKEIPKIEKFDTGGWWKNLAIGIVATVALAAVAVVTVATFGVGLVAFAAIGATIGACVVTVSSAVSDKKSGVVRSWQDMLMQTVMGACIGATAGASAYGLYYFAPMAADAIGLKASMILSDASIYIPGLSQYINSKLTAMLIPKMVRGLGYGLMGLQVTFATNEINAMTSGKNFLLEKVFGNNKEMYDGTFLVAEIFSMMLVQIGMDNIGLAKPKNYKQESQIDEPETPQQEKKAVAQDGDEVGDSTTQSTVKNTNDVEEGIDGQIVKNNNEGGVKTGKIKPSGAYDENAVPKGEKTKISKKADEATTRSLTRENEAADTLAKNGYDIEQNPKVEGTTRNPDYKIEGDIFDCYSPSGNTSTRNIGGTIEEKVIQKGQTNRVVLNLDDWNGNIDDIVKQLINYPIDGLDEVITIKNGEIISIYP